MGFEGGNTEEIKKDIITVTCPICTQTQIFEYDDPINEYIHVECPCGCEYDIIIRKIKSSDRD